MTNKSLSEKHLAGRHDQKRHAGDSEEPIQHQDFFDYISAVAGDRIIRKTDYAKSADRLRISFKEFDLDLSVDAVLVIAELKRKNSSEVAKISSGEREDFLRILTALKDEKSDRNLLLYVKGVDVPVAVLSDLMLEIRTNARDAKAVANRLVEKIEENNEDLIDNTVKLIGEDTDRLSFFKTTSYRVGDFVELNKKKKFLMSALLRNFNRLDDGLPLFRFTVFRKYATVQKHLAGQHDQMRHSPSKKKAEEVQQTGHDKRRFDFEDETTRNRIKSWLGSLLDRSLFRVEEGGDSLYSNVSMYVRFSSTPTLSLQISSPIGKNSLQLDIHRVDTTKNPNRTEIESLSTLIKNADRLGQEVVLSDPTGLLPLSVLEGWDAILPRELNVLTAAAKALEKGDRDAAAYEITIAPAYRSRLKIKDFIEDDTKRYFSQLIRQPRYGLTSRTIYVLERKREDKHLAGHHDQKRHATKTSINKDVLDVQISRDKTIASFLQTLVGIDDLAVSRKDTYVNNIRAGYATVTQTGLTDYSRTAAHATIHASLDRPGEVVIEFAFGQTVQESDILFSEKIINAANNFAGPVRIVTRGRVPINYFKGWQAEISLPETVLDIAAQTHARLTPENEEWLRPELETYLGNQRFLVVANPVSYPVDRLLDPNLTSPKHQFLAYLLRSFKMGFYIAYAKGQAVDKSLDLNRLYRYPSSAFDTSDKNNLTPPRNEKHLAGRHDQDSHGHTRRTWNMADAWRQVMGEKARISVDKDGWQVVTVQLGDIEIQGIAYPGNKAIDITIREGQGSKSVSRAEQESAKQIIEQSKKNGGRVRVLDSSKKMPIELVKDMQLEIFTDHGILMPHPDKRHTVDALLDELEGGQDVYSAAASVLTKTPGSAKTRISVQRTVENLLQDQNEDRQLLLLKALKTVGYPYFSYIQDVQEGKSRAISGLDDDLDGLDSTNGGIISGLDGGITGGITGTNSGIDGGTDGITGITDGITGTNGGITGIIGTNSPKSPSLSPIFPKKDSYHVDKHLSGQHDQKKHGKPSEIEHATTKEGIQAIFEVGLKAGSYVLDTTYNEGLYDQEHHQAALEHILDREGVLNEDSYVYVVGIDLPRKAIRRISSLDEEFSFADDVSFVLDKPIPPSKIKKGAAVLRPSDELLRLQKDVSLEDYIQAAPDDMKYEGFTGLYGQGSDWVYGLVESRGEKSARRRIAIKNYLEFLPRYAYLVKEGLVSSLSDYLEKYTRKEELDKLYWSSGSQPNETVRKELESLAFLDGTYDGREFRLLQPARIYEGKHEKHLAGQHNQKKHGSNKKFYSIYPFFNVNPSDLNALTLIRQTITHGLDLDTEDALYRLFNDPAVRSVEISRKFNPYIPDDKNTRGVQADVKIGKNSTLTVGFFPDPVTDARHVWVTATRLDPADNKVFGQVLEKILVESRSQAIESSKKAPGYAASVIFRPNALGTNVPLKPFIEMDFFLDTYSLENKNTLTMSIVNRAKLELENLPELDLSGDLIKYELNNLLRNIASEGSSINLRKVTEFDPTSLGADATMVRLLTAGFRKSELKGYTLKYVAVTPAQ